MAEHRSRNRKPAGKSEADVIEEVFGVIFSGIGSIFKALFMGGASGKQKAAALQARRLELQGAWEQVELHLLQGTFSVAVSDADKLLDAGLQAIGVHGATMGDRLKNAKDKFDYSLYQRIWEAHKLRNHLAHEVGAAVSAREAQAAVGAFREALYAIKILL